MVGSLLRMEETKKEIYLSLGWGRGRRERERKENKGHEQMSCSVRYYEISKVTPLGDLMHVQEILQNHKKLEVTGFLVKTSKVTKFCIIVIVGSKIETVNSGTGAESEIRRP